MVKEEHFFKDERLSLEKEDVLKDSSVKQFLSFRKEIGIIVGLVAFLWGIYALSHFLMDRKSPLLPVMPAVIQEEEDTTPTDLLFPVMKEENIETEELTEKEQALLSGMHFLYKHTDETEL